MPASLPPSSVSLMALRFFVRRLHRPRRPRPSPRWLQAQLTRARTPLLIPALHPVSLFQRDPRRGWWWRLGWEWTTATMVTTGASTARRTSKAGAPSRFLSFSPFRCACNLIVVRCATSGSDNPRSYYKCTEKDCPVKKQARHTASVSRGGGGKDRQSHDASFLCHNQVEKNGDHTINTYEGTHNHLAPGLNGSILCRRRGKKKPQPHQEEEEEDGEEEEEEEDGEEEGEGVREGELGGGDDSAGKRFFPPSFPILKQTKQQTSVHIPEASNGNGTCLLPARKRHKRPEDSGDSSAQMQPFPPSSHSSMHALLTASSSPSLSSVVIPPPQLIHDNQQQSSEPYWDRSNSQHHEQQQPQDASYMNTWWENKDRRDTSGLFNPHFSNLSTLYSALGTPAPTSSPLSSRFLPLTSAQPLPTSFQLSNSSASAFFSSPVIHSLLANTNSPFSSMHPSGSNGLPATPNTPGVLPQLMSLPSDSPLYQALAATLARTWPNDSVTERGSGDYNCETGGTGEKETQQGGSTTENSRAMQEGSSTGEQTPLMHQFYYPSFQPFPSSSLQQQSSSSVSLAPLPVIVYPTNHSSSPSSATPLQSTMGTSEGAAELLRINDDLTEMD